MLLKSINQSIGHVSCFLKGFMKFEIYLMFLLCYFFFSDIIADDIGVVFYCI